jgi:hypothetical protein
MSRDLRSMSAADLDGLNARAKAARKSERDREKVQEPEHSPVPNHVPEGQESDQQLELF